MVLSPDKWEQTSTGPTVPTDGPKDHKRHRQSCTPQPLPFPPWPCPAPLPLSTSGIYSASLARTFQAPSQYFRLLSLQREDRGESSRILPYKKCLQDSPPRPRSQMSQAMSDEFNERRVKRGLRKVSVVPSRSEVVCLRLCHHSTVATPSHVQPLRPPHFSDY